MVFYCLLSAEFIYILCQVETIYSKYTQHTNKKVFK